MWGNECDDVETAVMKMDNECKVVKKPGLCPKSGNECWCKECGRTGTPSQESV